MGRMRVSHGGYIAQSCFASSKSKGIYAYLIQFPSTRTLNGENECYWSISLFSIGPVKGNADIYMFVGTAPSDVKPLPLRLRSLCLAEQSNVLKFYLPCMQFTYPLCEAVDQQCLDLEFIKMEAPERKNIVRSISSSMINCPETISKPERCDWDSTVDGGRKRSRLNFERGCHETSRRTVGNIVEFLGSKSLSAMLKRLEVYQTRMTTSL